MGMKMKAMEAILSIVSLLSFSSYVAPTVFTNSRMLEVD